jgi:hypothetical protein
MTSNYQHPSAWDRLTPPELAWCLDVRLGTVIRWYKSGRITASGPAGARSLRFSLDRALDELDRTSRAHRGRGVKV